MTASCVICDTTFTKKRTGQVTCGQLCNKKHWNRNKNKMVKQHDTHCQKCNKSFDDVKIMARNLCISCYRKELYKKKVITPKRPKIVRPPKVERINLQQVNEDGKKFCRVCLGVEGDKLKRFVRGCCYACYQRELLVNRNTHCKSCGIFFGEKGSGFELCSECRPSSQFRRVSWWDLTPESRTEIVILLTKFKHGIGNHIDLLRVCHQYMEILERFRYSENNKTYLYDTKPEMDQVVLMLKSLHNIYLRR